MSEMEKFEQTVDQYVQEGRTREAVELLFKMIVKTAGEKNFTKAEAYRDRLFDVDSMALNEIIRSAEIIEQEKSEALDADHMEIWSDLYDTLSTEESNILYFAMKKAEYQADEPIFAQGKKNDRLYFINSGQSKLFYSQSGTEKLIRTLGPGMLAGDDSFFSITLCTTTLSALNRVKVNYLEQATYQKWQKEMPVLATKLETFCSKLTKNHEILREKGMNRRAFHRVKVGGIVRFQVLNTAGEPIGKEFKGDLGDISVGGLSFFIKTSNRKNALMLLGRKLRVKVEIPLDKKPIEISQEGRITGVINHLFSDYSIHMKFDKPLSRVVVEEIEHNAKKIQEKTAAAPERIAR